METMSSGGCCSTSSFSVSAAPLSLIFKPKWVGTLTNLRPSLSCKLSSSSGTGTDTDTDTAHMLFQDDLEPFLEVLLDLGRLPEARYLGEVGGQYLRSTEVWEKELEDAQNAVGEFGGDNRAGIEGTLHRISAIRNRKGDIVGMTCRVGRAVSGHIDMVHDLLQYGNSILFVGRQVC